MRLLVKQLLVEKLGSLCSDVSVFIPGIWQNPLLSASDFTVVRLTCYLSPTFENGMTLPSPSQANCSLFYVQYVLSFFKANI